MKKKLLKGAVCAVMAVGSAVGLAGCGEQHEHTFDAKYTYNEEYHWKEATCEHTTEKGYYSKHGELSYKTYQEYGLRIEDCPDCGYKFMQELPNLVNTTQFASLMTTNYNNYSRKDVFTSEDGVENVYLLNDKGYYRYEEATLQDGESNIVVDDFYIKNGTSYDVYSGKGKGVYIENNQSDFDVDTNKYLPLLDLTSMATKFDYFTYDMDNKVYKAYAVYVNGETFNNVEIKFKDQQLVYVSFEYESNSSEYSTRIQIGGADFVCPWEATEDFYFRPDVEGVIITGTKADVEDLDVPESITVSGKTYDVNRIKSLNVLNVTSGSNTPTTSDCTTMTKLTIPTSIQTIDFGALKSCVALQELTIPFIGATNKGVEVECFGAPFGATTYHYHNTYVPQTLTKLTILGGEFVGTDPFNGVTSIRTLIIGDGVTEIRAINGMTNLETVVVGDGVTEIKEYTFRNLNNLTSVKLGNGVTTIKENGIYGCRNITELILGENVRNIELGGISRIDDTAYTIYENGYYLPSATNEYFAFIGLVDDNVTTITFNANTKLIGPVSIRPENTIASLVIPDSVVAISDRAFEGNITSLTFGSGLKYIGEFIIDALEVGTINFADKNGWKVVKGADVKTPDLSTNDSIITLFRQTYNDYDWIKE